MSHHPRIEEVSDSDSASASDPEDMDPSDFLPTDMVMRPKEPAKAPQNVPTPAAASGAQPQYRSPPAPSAAQAAAAQAEMKGWASIYPVYFDSTRSLAGGRRVGKELAVANPLAREIAEATQSLGLSTALEPGKMHPKDWANPGRVKVNVRGRSDAVKNKHHLYIKIAEWLQEHPTTERTPLRLPVQGLPSSKVVPPVVPRGWKMGTILPLHSPAVTGGGVSENMLKEMMAQMQGEEGGMPGLGSLGAGPQGGPSGGQPKRKDKKKNKA